MDEKFRILHIGALNSCGGIETFQINLIRAINKKQFVSDVIVGNLNCRLIYEKEIENYGGKVFYLPNKSQGFLKRIKLFRNIIKKYNYKAVHVHCGTLSDIFFIKEVLKLKNTTVVMHSHTSTNKSWFWRTVHYINKSLLAGEKVIRLACSVESGHWLYDVFFKKNNFSVIKNGIDIEKYKFSLAVRSKIRQSLNISMDDFVVGHIARFSYEKNYGFIIKLLESLNKISTNAKFLLVGDGPLKNSVVKQVEKLGLKDYVIFTGLRTDINELMAAMDVFILPSLYEGLPFSLIEAQAAGLNSFVSENITDEACLTELVHKLPIDENSIGTWCEQMITVHNNIEERCFPVCEITKHGFNIKYTANCLEKIYTKELEKID